MLTKTIRSLSTASLVVAVVALNAMAHDGCNYQKETKSDGAAKAQQIGMTDKAWHEKAPEVSQTELSEWIKAGKVVLIDANGEKSYAEGHIPGALNLAWGETVLTSKLPKEKDALIVAYCGGPTCEAWCKAASLLEKQGYTNLRHFKGGLKGWVEAGGKLEKPKEQKG